jgi:hypothetical protein
VSGFDFRPPKVIDVERAFGVRLDERESARCTSAAATTDLLVARLGATDDDRPPLRPVALGSVREALRGMFRIDRETVTEKTRLDRLFPLDGRSTHWRLFGDWLDADLPPLVSGGIPPRLATVEGLVDWLVAADPARLRAGTDWTRPQIAEVVALIYDRRVLG